MEDLDARQRVALKEYETLRAEIIARIVMRDQMINYAAGVFAAVIGFAAYVGKDTQHVTTSWILLCYPPVAYTFTRGWSIHDIRVWEIGTYIRQCMEKNGRLPGLMWESTMQMYRDTQSSWLSRHQNWFATFTFVGSSAFAMILGLAIFVTNATDSTPSVSVNSTPTSTTVSIAARPSESNQEFSTPYIVFLVATISALIVIDAFALSLTVLHIWLPSSRRKKSVKDQQDEQLHCCDPLQRK